MNKLGRKTKYAVKVFYILLFEWVTGTNGLQTTRPIPMYFSYLF